MTDVLSADPVADRRLAWQCRRGMRELDELLGVFLRRRYPDLDARQRQAFSQLLDYPDTLLLELLMGRMTSSDRDVAALVRDIRDTAAD